MLSRAFPVWEGLARWWGALTGEPWTAEERDIARAILRYLETHPEAKDTLAGIAHWWLGLEGGERTIGEVERAVSFLCSEGHLLETRRKGLPPYYQLYPEKEHRDV